MWIKRTVSIPHQNRFIKAIVDEQDNIILDCAMFDIQFINNLLYSVNNSLSSEYKRGLEDGVEIAKSVYVKGE